MATTIPTKAAALAAAETLLAGLGVEKDIALSGEVLRDLVALAWMEGMHAGTNETVATLREAFRTALTSA